ncbi:hypothetical protein FS837_009028 [Tulasnella sp. UAMH 9824]|nr:hypothetical protein FS837_009028 [Tulasnella sp. UAMH 9824]
MVDARSIAVDLRSARATSRTPSFPPFPSKKFVCSPTELGLPRTGLGAVSNQSRFLAIMDSLAYQIQGLSLSEPSAGQAIGSSVHTKTPNRTESTNVEASQRRNLSESRSKTLYKCTQSLRVSLKRATLKRSDRTKKTGGASRPPSQWLSQADKVVGQTFESRSGRSALEALDVNQYPQSSWFNEVVSSDVQQPTTRGAFSYTSPLPIYFGVPPSNSPPAVSTTGDQDEPADTPMDDYVQSSSPQPTSPAPTPMEIEVGTPPGSPPSSPRAPFRPSMNNELDPSVSETTDTTMRDEEDVSRETDGAASETLLGFRKAAEVDLNCRIPPQRDSTSLDQDIDMENQDESESFTPLRTMPIPPAEPMKATSAFNELEGTSEMDISRGPAPTSAPAATVNIMHQEEDPAQTLPRSGIDTSPQFARPTEVAQNEETSATQPQVSPIQSPGSVSTSTGTATSAAGPLPVATPSPTATSSTTEPTTPTLSARSDGTAEQDQPTQRHAAHLHEVLGKWGLSKQASKSSQPAVSDPEEAEAEAYFANLRNKAAGPPPIKAKSNPAYLPSLSEPKPTKGSAARSLMDDIMAGFQGMTKPRPSQQPTPPAAHPQTKPYSAARNPPRSWFVPQGPSPAVVARQTGPQSAPPHCIGNGSGMSASSGSVNSPSRAPPAVPNIGNGSGMSAPGGSVIPHGQALPAAPMPSKVSGPSGHVSAAPPSDNVPHKTTSEPSTIAPGGERSGQERAIKGTRRVAKAVVKTGLTWQIVQQRAREAQAASDLDQLNAAARIPAGSLNSTQPPEPLEEEPIVKRRCL